VYSGILEKESQIDLTHCAAGTYFVSSENERISIVKSQ
jgi:hypothetical protein